MAKRHNTKGRSTTDRFVALPHWMLQSAAWHALTPVARSIWIEIAALYNGGNNGRLALSARKAAERVGCSKNTAARSLTELVEKGFIDLAQPGHFDRKSPHAAEYRLTLYPCDRTGEHPSKRFMRWRSESPKSVAGPIRGTDGPTSGTVQAKTVPRSAPRSLSWDRAPRFDPSSGPTTGTHIIYQEGYGDEAEEDPGSRGYRHAS